MIGEWHTFTVWTHDAAGKRRSVGGDVITVRVLPAPTPSSSSTSEESEVDEGEEVGEHRVIDNDDGTYTVRYRCLPQALASAAVQPGVGMERRGGGGEAAGGHQHAINVHVCVRELDKVPAVSVSAGTAGKVTTNGGSSGGGGGKSGLVLAGGPSMSSVHIAGSPFRVSLRGEATVGTMCRVQGPGLRGGDVGTGGGQKQGKGSSSSRTRSPRPTRDVEDEVDGEITVVACDGKGTRKTIGGDVFRARLCLRLTAAEAATEAEVGVGARAGSPVGGNGSKSKNKPCVGVRGVNTVAGGVNVPVAVIDRLDGTYGLRYRSYNTIYSRTVAWN